MTIRFTYHCLAPQKDDLNFLSQIFYEHSCTYSYQRRDSQNTGEQVTAAYCNSAESGSRDKHDGWARGSKVRDENSGKPTARLSGKASSGAA